MTNDYISREAAIETLDEQVTLCDKALKSFEISLKDEYAVKVERASLVAYKEQLKALPSTDVVPVETLKAEIYKLKHQSEQGFGNHDYYVGYISALSIVEGILAVMDREE